MRRTAYLVRRCYCILWDYKILSCIRVTDLVALYAFAVVIFNLSEPGNVSKALNGDQIVILIDPSGRII